MTAAAAENKPNSDNGRNNNNKKRKQRYLPHNRPAKKGSYPLRPGVEGFFITCDGGREKQATHEAINLFDTFYEELHGGGSGPKCETVAPTKCLNKITKFSDSDSSSDESCSDEEDAQAVVPSVDKEGENKAADVVECVPPMEQRQETDIENKVVETESTPGKQHVGSDHEKHAEESKETLADTEISKTNSKDQKVETEGVALKKQRLNSGISKCQNADEEKDEEIPIDKQLEAELEELGDRNKRRFVSLDSGCNGVIVIQMNRRAGEPGPVEIVQHMMQSAAATRKHMSRFILRVLPVEATCYASEEEVSKAIKPFIARYFPTEAETPHKGTRFGFLLSRHDSIRFRIDLGALSKALLTDY
ncbi:hypothetical protein ACLOJK_000414 [Asimina triloba]